jgi:hypothetical protein
MINVRRVAKSVASMVRRDPELPGGMLLGVGASGVLTGREDRVVLGTGGS